MKKGNIFTRSILALIAIVGISSCTNNEDNPDITMYLNNGTNIPYDSDGLWSEALNPDAHITCQSMWFSHDAFPEYGSWSGFVASRSRDNADYTTENSWLDHQYTSMTGGGMSGEGTPYLVAYWNNYEDETIKFSEAS